MSWWVVSRASGIPKDPGAIAYVAIEADTRADATKYGTPGAGGTVAAGPFTTQAGANKWIDQKQGLPAGTKPGLPAQISAEKGPIDIPNPLSGLAAIAAALAKVAGYLGDLAMWRSLGWLVLGAVLMIAGIWLWAKQQGLTPKMPTVIPLPV